MNIIDYIFNFNFFEVWVDSFENNLFIKFIILCKINIKMLATTSHCLKLATKHHTHKLLEADFKIQKLLMCPKKVFSLSLSLSLSLLISRADHKKIMDSFI